MFALPAPAQVSKNFDMYKLHKTDVQWRATCATVI